MFDGAFRVFLLFLGIAILALTAFGALGTFLLYKWDGRTTQGSVILTSIGMSLIVLSAV